MNLEKYFQSYTAALKSGYTSLSIIQRENQIGYVEAGDILKRLQREGVVSSEWTLDTARDGQEKFGFHVIQKPPHWPQTSSGELGGRDSAESTLITE